MIKAILLGIGFYFAFSLMKSLLFFKNSGSKNQKNKPYKNLDIKDADFEDIDSD